MHVAYRRPRLRASLVRKISRPAQGTSYRWSASAWLAKTIPSAKLVVALESSSKLRIIASIALDSWCQ